MKKLIAFVLALSLIPLPRVSAALAAENEISIDAPSAILIEKTSGTVIYEKDAFSRRSPASVTKLMTMLLVAEAVDSGALNLEDTVTASARAAGMGGSQIWLEEGEQMSVGEMLKCVTVVSANDCCVALAEHLAGSEEAFVERMNARALELGLSDTHFTCCSGLTDSDDHYSCAHDLAIISRELLKHEFIKDYTTIWMDTIRGGEFGLSNTNKLIYHYDGATGLKTGYTSKAMHCLAASAQRDGVEFIAVVLGAESSSTRFESAKALLNYAFANYRLVSPETLTALPPVEVEMGKSGCVSAVLEPECGILTGKNSASLRCETSLPDSLSAPVEKGARIGTLSVYEGEKLISELPILAGEDVPRLGLWDIFCRLLASLSQI